MKTTVVSGAAIAAAAISLAIGGLAPTHAYAKSAKVHCMGINACKGKSACKTASNACKGQNACKGKGFSLTKSEAACAKKGGTVASAQ